jgi:RING-box protein 1
MSQIDSIEIKKIKPVFVWKWKLINESCSICRSELQESCIECQANFSSSSSSSSSSSHLSECPIAWGNCGHAFHQHCIFRWLKKNNTCPLDMSDWSTVKIS